jgi:hypothetical protein
MEPRDCASKSGGRFETTTLTADAVAECRVNGTRNIIDVSRASGRDRTFLQSLMALGSVTRVALLVFYVVLLFRLPIALSVRAYSSY